MREPKAILDLPPCPARSIPGTPPQPHEAGLFEPRAGRVVVACIHCNGIGYDSDSPKKPRRFRDWAERELASMREKAG